MSDLRDRYVLYRIHGDTFRFPGGVDAVERDFGHGGTSTLCRPASGGRRDERGLPGLRHLAQDWLQDLQPLQARWSGVFDGPVAPSGSLCQSLPAQIEAEIVLAKKSKLSWRSQDKRFISSDYERLKSQEIGLSQSPNLQRKTAGRYRSAIRAASWSAFHVSRANHC